MRGYVTFILVFSAVILLLLSIEALTYSDKTNLTQAIAFSRVSKIDLNVKESLIELARQGANSGLNAYIIKKQIEAAEKCIGLVACPPPEYDQREAEFWVNSFTYSNILELENQSFADNVEVKFWCNNKIILNSVNLQKSMLDFNSALKCPSCLDINFCSNMITSRVDVLTGYHILPELKYVQLTDSTREGIIGISVFDKKYKSVSIGYIPINYKIKG